LTSHIVLTGDINLLGIDDPSAPFRNVDALRSADFSLGNLECCLYDPPEAREMMRDDVSGYEGLYAPAAAGAALKLAGFRGVGNANNQNYGADAILASNARLDALGVAHAGTGCDSAAAGAPLVLERNGVRLGFLQRTSQYWPNNHEAGERAAGVAALKAYTAYQPPYYKDNKIPPNRPGAPAKVITWTDPEYLACFRKDIHELKSKADVVISSHHWGYGEDVLQYMSEIAHAAIDAGADVVMGHGPHFPLAIEVYKGKPVFYGLGQFCFMRTNKRVHTGWVGTMANINMNGNRITKVSYALVRQAADTTISVQEVQREADEVARIQRLSAPFGTKFQTGAREVVVLGEWF
jgi:poly-gamma-glutamate capsule biosynthesis protein CapA/YwtB (metallophosphatase superfamily)